MKKLFNPENKTTLTYGEALGPAMQITTQENADQYKREYIAHVEKCLIDGTNENGQTAEQIVNINLGYYSGYYDIETQKRVEKLFNTCHPIFGSTSN